MALNLDEIAKGVVFGQSKKADLPLKICIAGASGSGKTTAALKIAGGLGRKIAVIDAEEKRTSFLIGQPEIPPFLSINISYPFTTDKYIIGIKAAQLQNFDVLVIDGLTQHWEYLREMVASLMQLDSKLNEWTAATKTTPEYNRLIQAILRCKIHIIATVRSKTVNALVGAEGTKKVMKQIGYAPIQKKELPFDFDTYIEIEPETHLALAKDKDRTKLFNREPRKISRADGVALQNWLNSDDNNLVENEEINSEINGELNNANILAENA